MELPVRKRNRLADYDYSMPNAYFITVCTDKRKNYFWKDAGTNISNSKDIPLTEYGKIVRQSILDIPKHYPMISVDRYVVMPNHVHLLMQINTDPDGQVLSAPVIGTVINQMKGVVTNQIGFSVWQKGFYDHIIRTDVDYQEVWKYVEGNPGKWLDDELAPVRDKSWRQLREKCV